VPLSHNRTTSTADAAACFACAAARAAALEYETPRTVGKNEAQGRHLSHLHRRALFLCGAAVDGVRVDNNPCTYATAYLLVATRNFIRDDGWTVKMRR
jgi:hypothetical protein